MVAAGRRRILALCRTLCILHVVVLHTVSLIQIMTREHWVVMLGCYVTFNLLPVARYWRFL